MKFTKTARLPMVMSPLRKLLKDNKTCNPFNDSFNYDAIKPLVRSTIPLELFKQDPLSLTIGLTPFMNSFYTDFFKTLKETVATINLPHEKLIEGLFVFFSRNYLGLHKRQQEHIAQKKSFTQNELYTYRTSTMNEDMGPVEINSALEVEVDAFNYVLNYTRYFRNDIITVDSTIPDSHSINACQLVALSAAYYTIIKSTYEDSIWNYGHWVKRADSAKAIFDVVYPEADLLLANKVGLIRLQKNTTSATMQLLPEIVKQTPNGKLVASVARLRKKPRQLSSVTIQNGYIQPVVSDGFSEMQDVGEIRNNIELDTFYAFLDNPPLKNLNGLQLQDLIKLFSLLQDLFRQTAALDFDDGIDTLNDFGRFPIKIERAVLLNYFEQRTNYLATQLETFISLLTGKYGDKLNLWDRPLVQLDKDLFVNYMPVLNPILLNLIDYWLDQGGFLLDERGKLLEKYLASEITEALQTKGFEGHLPPSAKIYNLKKQFEEIDLLLNLKEVVVAAEVKCIKYPFDARDHHNALNRLEEAAKQVKRKMEFIQQNEKEIEVQTGSLTGKKLLPMIVTNYPIYSTFTIDGIIVTDFYLLEGYFAEGAFRDVSMQPGKTPQIVKEYSYYSDEKEMNNNLADFLANPPPVTTLKDMFEIRPFKVSMDGLDYDIYVTSGQVKANNTENIISNQPA